MPVGTVGAVKTLAPWELKELGAEIILGNAYHLNLRPGDKIIKKNGGLQKWTKWRGPILTDSGGFQVFSLGNKITQLENGKSNQIKPAKITEDGVEFYSHLDGSRHYIDAEKSIKIQQDLGADIIMAFDECPPGDAPRNYVVKAVDRTHRWLDRSIKVWSKQRGQALFGIVQGGTDKKLRIASAKYINSKDLPGNAIGGVAVGESRQDMWKAVEWSVPNLDINKPRYLMGVGEPVDIIEAVKRGCDMFDCVLPTRLARHGVVWIMGKGGKNVKSVVMPDGIKFVYSSLDMRSAKLATEQNVIDKHCDCPACKSYTSSIAGRSACRGGFSRSYLSHLIKENEVLGIRLLTMHNLRFLFKLIKLLHDDIVK